MNCCNRFGVSFIEKGIMSKYKNQYLGAMGDLGCFSFHEIKNITCEQGGALL